MTFIVNNQTILTDKQGYLINCDDWNEQVALTIAEIEQVELTDSHWEVIHYVRDFYLKFNKSPAMRPLVNYLKLTLGDEKANSLYLAQLFPGGAAKQSTKLAGLPRPARCI